MKAEDGGETTGPLNNNSSSSKTDNKNYNYNSNIMMNNHYHHGDDRGGRGGGEDSWNNGGKQQQQEQQQQRNPSGFDEQQHNSYRSMESNGLGSIPLQPGEVVENEYERPLSAPPPPGFGGGPEERNRLATELLWGAGTTSSSSSAVHPGFHHLHNHPIPHSGLSRDDASGGSSYGSGGQIGAAMSGDRTSSFSNLAAVLGTGLAQSMEDATRERNFNTEALFLSSTPANNNNTKEDLSLARQTRHAASRLIGTSPPNFGDPVYRHHHYTNSAGDGPPPSSTLFASAPPFKMNNSQSGMAANDPVYSRAPGPAAGGPRSTGGGSVRNDAGGGGYSPSYSSPERKQQQQQQPDYGVDAGSEKRRTPVQMFPGQQGQRRALPVTKDIGMNVSEPDGDNQFSSAAFTSVVSQRMDTATNASANGRGNNNNMYGGQQQQQQQQRNPNSGTMWNSGAREFKPASLPVAQPFDNQSTGGNSSLSDTVGTGTEISSRQAEAELRPFLWDIDRRPSRTIAILHVAWLRAPDVRSSCEAFGVLESFRADFSNMGIFFVSFYDIRSAQYAAVELQSVLQRLTVLQGSSEEVIVRYCLPLNSSSQFDESQILITDLPDDIDDHSLRSMLSSYGAVRSVICQGLGTFLIEFHNVQDAKQALLELESSQPWGSGVNFEVGLRNPADRKRGRELLAMISRWRHGTSRGGGGGGGGNNAPMDRNPAMASTAARFNIQGQHFSGGGQQNMGGSVSEIRRVPMMSSSGSVHSEGYSSQPGRPHETTTTTTTQLVLGPDGRYTQVILQNPSGGFSPYEHQQTQQQIVHGPNGQIFITSVPVAHHGQQIYIPQHNAIHPGHPAYQATIVTNPSYMETTRGRVSTTSTPFYTHIVATDASSTGGRSHHSTSEDKDTRHLLLDLDAVENGRDSRTSLMVRNIPNKYTQQMLLSEFMENGHGPGIIDFFYLPIDFKNRCNRGYAFINFVDCKDILPFHRRYFGKHWRTFNSDKICDITYARIQGKAAMLKRFENSALMEKDDEYKPLVFVSDGPDKGKRLPFPDPSNMKQVVV